MRARARGISPPAVTGPGAARAREDFQTTPVSPWNSAAPTTVNFTVLYKGNFQWIASIKKFVHYGRPGEAGNTFKWIPWMMFFGVLKNGQSDLRHAAILAPRSDPIKSARSPVFYGWGAIASLGFKNLRTKMVGNYSYSRFGEKFSNSC